MMFNKTHSLNLALKKINQVYFFKKLNRSVVSRFNNFLFKTFHLGKKLTFWGFYKKLVFSGKFTSRKDVVLYKYKTYRFDSMHGWLFLYLWKIKLNDDEEEIFKYIRYRTKVCYYIMRKPAYSKWKFKRRDDSTYSGMYIDTNDKYIKSFIDEQRSFFPYSNKILVGIYRKKRLLFKYMWFYLILCRHIYKTHRRMLHVFYKNIYNIENKRFLIHKNKLTLNSNQFLSILGRKCKFRARTFWDLSPNRYINSILRLSKNKITPFAIKKKTFISQREVHYSSICFFLEKSSSVYKNSYFLGLVINGGKRKPCIPIKTFRLLTYRFNKHPYSIQSGTSWL